MRRPGILAAVVGALVAAAPAAAAPPLAPRVVRVETIATDAQAFDRPHGSPGDTWGGQQSRIVRRSDGSLLAAYLTSPPGIRDPSRAQWVLLRRGPRPGDRWVELARRRAGREPMHLVRGPDDTAYVVAWPGTPRIWAVHGDAVGPGRRIPGAWERLAGSSTPYSGVAIGRRGRLCLAASRGVLGTDPGAPYTADSAWDVACRAPDGRWSPLRTLPIGLRFCYPYLHLRRGGALDLVGTRDVLWEAVGWPQVPGTFDYVFDGVDRWRLPPGGGGAPRRLELGETPFTTPAVEAPAYAQTDSLVDRRGRLHVLVDAVDAAGAGRLEHVVVDADGRVRRAAVHVHGYTRGALRLVEDPSGRLLLLFVQGDAVRLYPTTDRDGLALGRPVDLTRALTAGRTVEGPAYLATVRGGTPRGRLVDLLLTLHGRGGRLVTRAARIALYRPSA